MGYAPFDFDEIEDSPATVATLATVDRLPAQSVASVASVAAIPLRSPAETVATFATVAGVHAETRFSPPVPVDEIALRFERHVAALIAHHRLSRPDAEARARRLLSAELHNDPRLAAPVSPSNSCAVCGAADRTEAPLMPILSARPGEHVWLHPGDCHAAYRAHVADRVNALMQEAFGL